MMILRGIDDMPLTKLLAGDAPVASVYFDVRSSADAPLRWRKAADRLTELGAPAATVEALEQQVLDAVPGPGMLAAFTLGDEVTLAAALPGIEMTDVVRYAALPYLRPLLAWEQEHPARILAVLDRTGADISAYPAGSTEPVDATVTGPDDEIERNAPGGWSQGRYQHRAEDSWEHNSAAVAEVLARLLKRFDAHILLLAGDIRALQYLDEHLPRWIRADVTVGRLRGGRSQDGSEVRRPAQIAVQTQRIVAEENDVLLAEFAAHVGTGGSAVQGPDDTFAALAAGRVRVLLLPETPGPDSTTAWFGSGPTDLALQADQLQQAGLTPENASLEDVAVRAALLTSADVRIVPDESFAIAALCRFTP